MNTHQRLDAHISHTSSSSPPSSTSGSSTEIVVNGSSPSFDTVVCRAYYKLKEVFELEPDLRIEPGSIAAHLRSRRRSLHACQSSHHILVLLVLVALQCASYRPWRGAWWLGFLFSRSGLLASASVDPGELHITITSHRQLQASADGAER